MKLNLDDRNSRKDGFTEGFDIFFVWRWRILDGWTKFRVKKYLRLVGEKRQFLVCWRVETYDNDCLWNHDCLWNPELLTKLMEEKRDGKNYSIFCLIFPISRWDVLIFITEQVGKDLNKLLEEKCKVWWVFWDEESSNWEH